ncbi:MAG: hypothetical protein PVF05_08980 [Gemmatimonadales bacterium]|jgi:hypothetical protein
MSVHPRFPSALAALAVLLLPPGLAAQEAMGNDAMSQEDMIASALSAAPDAIADNAAVADLQGNVLRAGSNGYTCLPDDPNMEGNSPMCLDETWLAWAQALLGGEAEPPAIEHVSFGYMLQGDFPSSNLSPAHTEMTADNEWIVNSGPHVMVLFPDASMMDGISTDKDNGGPWVMWRESPYIHLMIPVTQK